MEKLVIIVILFVFLTIVVIIGRHGLPSISQYCETDKDCSDGYKCISNPEMKGKKQCFPEKGHFCSLEEGLLKECDPSSKDSCEDCLNQPSFSCLVVDDKNPYEWKQGDTSIKIPNSRSGKGWCLPDVKTDRYCNPHTSDYVLIETSPGHYEWGCYCKYPNLFTSAEPGGDCNIVRACGSENNNKNNLFVPTDKECEEDKDCESDERCLIKRDPPPCGTKGDKKVCHKIWNKDTETQHNINPLSGQCVCDKGQKYQCLVTGEGVYRMNCIHDSCGEYGSTTDCKSVFGNCVTTPRHTCCNCPPGFLKCPEDIPATNTAVCVTCLNQPKCLPDPCAPLGHYDPHTQRCVCTALGSAPKTDEDSAVGEVCVDLCKDNGPCADRGKCYVKEEDGRKVAKCCECVYEKEHLQDKTGLCLYNWRTHPKCESDNDCFRGKCINYFNTKVCGCLNDADCGNGTCVSHKGWPVGVCVYEQDHAKDCPK